MRGPLWWRTGVSALKLDWMHPLFLQRPVPPSKISSSRYPWTKNLFYFLNIYRPPSSSTPTFDEQFQSLKEDIHHTTENLVIFGDFKLHLETTCSKSKTFHSLIDSFDFIQKVNFPTHIHRHTLDLVLTKFNNDNISNVHTIDAFSDHFSVRFTLNFLTPRSQNNTTVSFRKYHKIDKEKMKVDILASELINNPSKEPDTLYKQYHTTLSTLINKHAPLHTKHTKAKYIPGWVNESVIAAKENKRLFERIWWRNKSTFNRSQYMQKAHQYNRICMKAKSQFLKAKFRAIITKIMACPGLMCYTDFQPRSSHWWSLLSFWLTGLWHSSQKNWKNTLNILCFCQFATHHPWLSFPYVLHFFYCNRGSSY